jgi:hypothetical protein
VTVMTTGSPILVVGLSNDTAISAPAKTASAVEKISKKLIVIEIIIFLLTIKASLYVFYPIMKK